MNDQHTPYVSRLLALVGIDDPMAVLAETPVRLLNLVARLDAATGAHKPGPSRWSINEIAAHLADAELVAGYRIRQILSVDGTPLQAFDQDRWASLFDYASWDARDSARLFGAYRAGTLRLLRQTDPSLLHNHGLHEERGPETVRHLVTLYAGHDRNHLAQIERIVADAKTGSDFAPLAQKPEIPLDVLDRIDLRLGTIVGVDTVPKARRLVRLTVDFGRDTRYVVAGIKDERSDPRVLLGRQTLFVYNVARRTIRGQESQAMLCDIGYADGLMPALLEVEWPMPNGARAG